MPDDTPFENLDFSSGLHYNMWVNDNKYIIYILYTLVASFLTTMTNSVYLEKDSATIYEEFSPEENYDEDDERSSDRMDEMISRYGSYWNGYSIRTRD